jgi:hypothetical protein
MCLFRGEGFAMKADEEELIGIVVHGGLNGAPTAKRRFVWGQERSPRRSAAAYFTEQNLHTKKKRVIEPYPSHKLIVFE